MANGEGFDEVVIAHCATLAEARNTAAEDASTDWLCFLDADDALEPGYLPTLRPLLQPGRLVAPGLKTVTGVGHATREALHVRDIRHLNPCVIGTLVERRLFAFVGGFLDEPIYEDWSLWLRCVNAGARIVHEPQAVYRARLRSGSRNDQPEAFKREWYWRIRRRYA